MLGFILFNLLFFIMAYSIYTIEKCSREEKIQRNRERNKELNKPDSNDYSI